MITDIITYNLRKRERVHLGQDRAYQSMKNIPALVKAINSGPVQELVNKGDMIGYYTHWPRIKFGMRAECGVIDGKVVCAEPAIRTTYLKASRKGMIRHRAEFLDTEAGRLCKRLHLSKTGGFSSVIDEITPDFIAFDYVTVPNFDSNRGYQYEPTLDSSVYSSAVMDSVNNDKTNIEKETLLAEYKRQIRLMDALFKGKKDAASRIKELETALDDALTTINRMQQESEELYSILSDKGYTVDSIGSDYVRPLITEKAPIEKFENAIATFDNASLPGIDITNNEEPKPDLIVQPLMIEEMIRRAK